MKKMEDFIDQFVDNLYETEDFRAWCAILDVEYEEPLLDDQWPDWIAEMQEKIAFALWDIYEPNPRKKYIIIVKSHTTLPDFEDSVMACCKWEAALHFAKLKCLADHDPKDLLEMIEEVK